MQSQTAVTAYLKSEQLLLFAFAIYRCFLLFKYNLWQFRSLLVGI